MVQVVNRSIIAASGSYQVSVPIEWARQHRLKGGEIVTLVVNDVIVVLPPHPLDKNRITRALDDAKTMAVVAQNDISPKRPDILEDI